MKTALFLLLLLALISVSGFTCKKTVLGTTCYKGRLEIKGICANYTIKLLEGTMDTGLLVKTWKDEVSGQTYQNVFALGSVCNFPADIKQGDEFYFTIDNNPIQNCAVCLAYYPTPPKILFISVSKNPCEK